MADIMLGGIGGQGVLTAGKILTEIAAAVGHNVCWTSEYSAEMRGGFAYSRVVISEEEIGSPYPDQLDVLVTMDQATYDKFNETVVPNGCIVVNSAAFPEGFAFRSDVNIVSVDAPHLAAQAKNPRGANLVMLGAMVANTDIIPADRFAEILTQYFTAKGKHVEVNLQCYYLGYGQQ